MSTPSHIKDTCRCGAAFSYHGYWSYAEAHHKTWLSEHAACRPAAGSATATKAEVARIVAEHWHRGAINNGWSVAGHALGMVLAALDGVTDPDELGLSGKDRDRVRAVVGPTVDAPGVRGAELGAPHVLLRQDGVELAKAVARVSEGFCPLCDGELGETVEAGRCPACAVRWWVGTFYDGRPALRSSRTFTMDEISKIYDREEDSDVG